MVGFRAVTQKCDVQGGLRRPCPSTAVIFNFIIKMNYSCNRKYRLLPARELQEQLQERKYRLSINSSYAMRSKLDHKKKNSLVHV